ncbi:hypothetical protein SAMN05444679_1095 [Variovorax sp. CF079]|nr:hypothetical protein SAMN05444679_1095 [Variovorax sp. CF079]
MSEGFNSRSARTTEVSIGAQLDATRNAASAREEAQAAIVRSFGSFIRGGPGPTEEQLRQFARLAADEARRRRRLADRLAARPADNEPKTPSPVVVARPLRAVALLAMWTVAIPLIVVAAFGPRDGSFSSASEKMPMHASPDAPAVALAQAPKADTEPLAVVAERSRAAPGKTPRRSSSAHASAAPLLARAGARGPSAKCTGLSFVFRAVCMNYACAQPSARRSLQCVEPLRQRRLDEARRNPLLLG